MASTNGKTAASMLFVLCAFCTLTSVPLRAAEPSARLDKLWTELASPDETTATRAALQLAAAPAEAVPFLKEHLRPVKADAKRVAALLTQCDSDDFARREEAAAELEYLGKYIKSDLEKAQAQTSSAEVKRHVQSLLERIAGEEAIAGMEPALTGRSVAVTNAGGRIKILIDGKPVNLTPLATPKPRMAWVRAARAAAVLEYANTPEARKVLETLAGGESDAPPTRAAVEALDRLKK